MTELEIELICLKLCGLSWCTVPLIAIFIIAFFTSERWGLSIVFLLMITVTWIAVTPFVLKSVDRDRARIEAAINIKTSDKPVDKYTEAVKAMEKEMSVNGTSR